MLNFKFRMPNNYTILDGGDMHRGNAGFNEELEDKYLHWLKGGKNRFLILGGDLCETIAPNDPRYSLKTHRGFANRIQAQKIDTIAKYSSVADKILLIYEGNHERKVSNICEIIKDITEYINLKEGTDIKCGHYMNKLDLGSFKMLDWHGDGGFNSRLRDYSRRIKSECNSLANKLQYLPSADCLVNVMHHVHKIRICPPEPEPFPTFNGKLTSFEGMKLSNGIIPKEMRWYASSGGLLEGYTEDDSSYIEKAGYPAEPCGWIIIDCKNGKLNTVEPLFL